MKPYQTRIPVFKHNKIEDKADMNMHIPHCSVQKLLLVFIGFVIILIILCGILLYSRQNSVVRVFFCLFPPIPQSEEQCTENFIQINEGQAHSASSRCSLKLYFWIFSSFFSLLVPLNISKRHFSYSLIFIILVFCGLAILVYCSLTWI